jgi:hypothetical protein
MKNLLLAGLVLGANLIVSTTAFAHPYYAYNQPQLAYNSLNARIQSDQQRIAQGVQSGTITNKEYNRLQSRSVQLQASLNRYTYDGNGLQPWEIRDIQRHQEKLSKSIYREKRDKDRRYHY